MLICLLLQGSQLRIQNGRGTIIFPPLLIMPGGMWTTQRNIPLLRLHPREQLSMFSLQACPLTFKFILRPIMSMDMWSLSLLSLQTITSVRNPLLSGSSSLSKPYILMPQVSGFWSLPLNSLSHDTTQTSLSHCPIIKLSTGIKLFTVSTQAFPSFLPIFHLAVFWYILCLLLKE